ncbi:MAG: PrsW family intramembrane metalloprotease [Haloarculaceae archaeon]
MGLARWLRTRTRNAARIARWEVTKNAGGVDKRTVAVAVVALVGLVAVGPLAAGQGVALDRGLYRVGVQPSSPYYGPVAADPTFVVQDPNPAAVDAGRQELLIRGGTVVEYAHTAKGRAALAELRSTVQRYNDRVMATEPNRTAAFPVLVSLSYRDRQVRQVLATGETGERPTPTGERGTAANTARTTASGGESEADTAAGTAASGSGNGTPSGGATPAGGETTARASGGATADATAGGETTRTETSSGGSGGLLGGLGGSSFTARLSGGSVSGTPSDITPPFPFRALVLAFVFVLPLNFIIQAYGSTMLSERINRRGELLLVSPVSRGDIIVGKTLPYFGAAVAIAAVITLALRGSAVSVLAVAPIALLFLSATFLGAMFARSFKELTFVTVTVTVSLTTYAFVPAIFTDVTPIALISPLTVVVRDLQGQTVGLGEFAFSTLPPTATALVSFGLGAGLYREEDMFTQRPIPLKVLDALAGRISRARSVATVSALLLPFVFVAELVAIAMVFALPGKLSIVLVLIAVAAIEEVAKSLHVFAGYAHAKFDRSLRTALTLGAFSGFGFFLAEKLTLVARLAHLPELKIGRSALKEAMLSDPLVLSFLVAPLALHVVTASISAVGARKGRDGYAVGLTAAALVHVGYNLTVVMVLGWPQ